MQQGPGKFELTFSLREVVVLFFVMIALFTGLLLFGFRVGYTQSSNTIRLQSQPMAPSQGNPESEPEAPSFESEPEIRLENSPPLGTVPWIAPWHGDPEEGTTLARQFGERRPWPCKPETRGWFRGEAAGVANNPSPDVADLEQSSEDEATRSVRPPATKPAAALSPANSAQNERQPGMADCTPTPQRSIPRSIAC